MGKKEIGLPWKVQVMIEWHLFCKLQRNPARKQKQCQMKKPDSLQIKELLMAGVGEPAQALCQESEAVAVFFCGMQVACSAFNFSFEVWILERETCKWEM